MLTMVDAWASPAVPSGPPGAPALAVALPFGPQGIPALAVP